MPKIVDSARRQIEIVDALLAVAAREGNERATSRAVAKELGVATGALWHYFPNFDAVLDAAAVEVTRRTLARIDRAAAGLSGLARLRATMAEVVPLNEETRIEARIVVGFWGRLTSRPPATEARSSVAWHDRIVDALSEAVLSGELAPTTPVDAVATLLHSVSYGQQVMQVIESPSRDHHWRVVEACIEGWLR